MGVHVSVDNLYKSFSTKNVLQGISVEIQKSESFVIVGASGSGKSVFLKSISRIIQPNSGHVKIDEVNIHQDKKKDVLRVMKNIGFLFQEIGLFDYMNVWENVAFFDLNVLRLKKSQAYQNAITRLEEVGISEKSFFIYPSQASLGMQKRIGLARILACFPDLVLLDEPTSGLDPILSNKIANVIRQNVVSSKSTSITITHDIHLAETVADRVGILHDGRFIWIGTAHDFKTTNNPSVVQFRSGSLEGPLDIDDAS